MTAATGRPHIWWFAGTVIAAVVTAAATVAPLYIQVRNVQERAQTTAQTINDPSSGLADRVIRLETEFERLAKRLEAQSTSSVSGSGDVGAVELSATSRSVIGRGFEVTITKCTRYLDSIACEYSVKNTGSAENPFMILVPQTRMILKSRILIGSEGTYFGTAKYAPLSSHSEIVETIPAGQAILGEFIFKPTTEASSIPEGVEAELLEIQTKSQKVSLERVPLAR